MRTEQEKKDNEKRYTQILQEYRKDIPVDARDAFLKAMWGRSYGLEETLDAWDWFYQGWQDG